MKSVGLDLALIIGVDSNLTILRKDNISRPHSPRATLVSPRMIIGRTLIRTSGTKSYAFVITAVRRAI
jgi:hypothetical protein